MPRTHKKYDEEFKRRAVELYLHNNNSLKQVARELGVSDGSLRKWRKDLFGDPADRQGGSHTLSNPEEMAREILICNGPVHGGQVKIAFEMGIGHSGRTGPAAPEQEIKGTWMNRMDRIWNRLS